jgi:hypothetical protein
MSAKFPEPIYENFEYKDNKPTIKVNQYLENSKVVVDGKEINVINAIMTESLPENKRHAFKIGFRQKGYVKHYRKTLIDIEDELSVRYIREALFLKFPKGSKPYEKLIKIPYQIDTHFNSNLDPITLNGNEYTSVLNEIKNNLEMGVYIYNSLNRLVYDIYLVGEIAEFCSIYLPDALNAFWNPDNFSYKAIIEYFNTLDLSLYTNFISERMYEQKKKTLMSYENFTDSAFQYFRFSYSLKFDKKSAFAYIYEELAQPKNILKRIYKANLKNTIARLKYLKDVCIANTFTQIRVTPLIGKTLVKPEHTEDAMRFYGSVENADLNLRNQLNEYRNDLLENNHESQLKHIVNVCSNDEQVQARSQRCIKIMDDILRRYEDPDAEFIRDLDTLYQSKPFDVQKLSGNDLKEALPSQLEESSKTSYYAISKPPSPPLTMYKLRRIIVKFYDKDMPVEARFLSPTSTDFPFRDKTGLQFNSIIHYVIFKLQVNFLGISEHTAYQPCQKSIEKCIEKYDELLQIVLQNRLASSTINILNQWIKNPENRAMIYDTDRSKNFIFESRNGFLGNDSVIADREGMNFIGKYLTVLRDGLPTKFTSISIRTWFDEKVSDINRTLKIYNMNPDQSLNLMQLFYNFSPSPVSVEIAGRVISNLVEKYVAEFLGTGFVLNAFTEKTFEKAVTDGQKHLEILPKRDTLVQLLKKMCLKVRLFGCLITDDTPVTLKELSQMLSVISKSEIDLRSENDIEQIFFKTKKTKKEHEVNLNRLYFFSKNILA